MAENATHNLHQISDPARRRSPRSRGWSRYLNEAIRLFGADTDVVFASHHWPTWGTERITTYLIQQRDIYAYLHDQTLRRMNQGQIGTEIAEEFELPPALEDVVEHPRLLRVVQPQRQGHLPALPGLVRRQPGAPVVVSAGAGGRRATSSSWAGGGRAGEGGRDFADGDLRWTATVVSHVVFADPDNARGPRTARRRIGEARSRRRERLVAQHLSAWCRGIARARSRRRAPELASPEVLGALTIEQLFDSLGVRLDGERAAEPPRASTGCSPTSTGPTAPNCPTAR